MDEDKVIAQVRAFNRFYTARIGVVRPRYLDTAFSLTEARVLFELGQRETMPVADLRAALDIDAGYLSRVVSRLAGNGLVIREKDGADARRQLIRLTAPGKGTMLALNARAAAQVRAMLSGVPEQERERLTAAMDAITSILDARPRPRTFTLRPPRAGDLGWVVSRNGALYHQEYGWDQTYEALVARIVADYADKHDPACEAAWIGEVDGVPAGCVFCVRDDERTARLRLLLVEPWARGMGLGRRLVDEVLRFARQAGYQRITLWTNDVLVSARRIYEAAGFTLDRESRHHSFGHDLTGQDWSRAL